MDRQSAGQQVKSLEVADQLARCDHEADVLGTRIGELLMRLTDVLRPVQPTTAQMPATPCVRQPTTAPLAVKLGKLADIMEEQVGVVRNILERLEV